MQLDAERPIERRERAPAKRERLVESAKALFYEQGIQGTSLADIASRADVPLGNVYYYFKSKDAILGAVVESRAREVRDALAALERKRTPQARLKALAHGWVDIADSVSRHGCPLGSLCFEIARAEGEATPQSEVLFAPVVDWIEAQIRAIGDRDARDLAFSLLSRIQGAALLAESFRDADVLTREAQLIARWIDGLAAR